ncbi:MAG: CvpA family protein [Rhodospirillales bacterium]|nr:CvpA family protein [Rhodospirillales bacterium]
MAEAGITIADVAVVLIVLISGLLAFVRGFVHEVLAVAGWIGAILATIYGLSYVRPFAQRIVGDTPLPVIGEFLDNKVVADIGSGVVIFIVTLIALSMLSGAVSSRVKDSQLNALDRSLGFAFGALRGLVLVSLAYLGAEWLMPHDEQPAWLRDARSAPLLRAGANMLRSLAPSESTNSGKMAAERIADGTRKALETERILREMMSPDPKAAPSGMTTNDGYSNTERKQMDRLFETSPGQK